MKIDRILDQFFGMRMMTLGLFAFLAAIATATFLESIYDIQTAKLLIYNALWFEILLVYLSVNLVSNIFKYRMIPNKKWASLLFHLSFLIIMLGAAITRFIGFEGVMPIREGGASQTIYSSDPYLWFRVHDGKMQIAQKVKMYQSEAFPDKFEYTLRFPGQSEPIVLSFLDFQKNRIDTVIQSPNAKGVAYEIVTDGMTSNYLVEGEEMVAGNLTFATSTIEGADLIVTQVKGAVYFESPEKVAYLPMEAMRAARESGQEVSDSSFVQVQPNTPTLFRTATLYKIGDNQFVFRGIQRNIEKKLVKAPQKDQGLDYLFVKIKQGDQSKTIKLEGGMGKIPALYVGEFNGLNVEMQYGSQRIELPFSIMCRDFQLERYPGSNSPSSFASELTFMDPEEKKNKDYRVFMNNVVDYKGYRFFQSSYDADEKGTVLSVNHDWWGTNVTYLGYFLMFSGMIWSLFERNGRFRELHQRIKQLQHKKMIWLVLALSTTFGLQAQHNQKDPVHRVISAEHAKELSDLPVQDYRGRIIPFHTMADQILRKLSRSNTYEGYNAVQTVLSMHMYPEYWMKQKLVYVNDNLLDSLQLKDGRYFSFNELSDQEGRFKLEASYNRAFQKLESKRNEYDKKLIKLGERFQVLGQVFTWNFMRIIPTDHGDNHDWVIPFSQEAQSHERSVNLSKLALNYLNAADSCAKVGDFQVADEQLERFKQAQRKDGGKIMPSERLLNWEVKYNSWNLFKRASYVYLLAGLGLLVLYFIQVFKTKTSKKQWALWVGTAAIALAGLAHLGGLLLRWKITGHAPWSNGYEAVVFIAWVTVLAGFLFSRNNKVVLAVTGILVFFMLFVTEMNLMDPEITPLQPVLKSYWLMIHVAIITGSYGFLGLSAILGILALTLYLLKSKQNAKRLTVQISEITYISEMTMTIGVFMLTIGTFLGGIWANESWGRYWGWDPKETWALVSVLVYAVVLHFRFIPALSGKLTFNVAALWSYSAILFTFFGVNFYLVGLHSYAQGEGLGKIPNGLILTVIIFLLFTVAAIYKEKKFKQS